MTNAKIRLPKRIERLEEVAYNLCWSWNPGARGLFKSVDRTLWRSTHHNPVKLLTLVKAETLEARAKDPAFLQWYDSVLAQFDDYLGKSDTWFAQSQPGREGGIAYFSAEFGLHNSLPIYSGGLGILAGDHCKTASDLGIPLVGVGFMYPQGYVVQRIGVEGWQRNHYEQLDWESAPVRPAETADGKECVIRLDLGAWPLHVKVWKVQAGRVPLYLMDTNVPGNTPGDREVSGRLYGGDQKMRLRQEIVLGIGGTRILRTLGVDVQLYHANEGHAAFLMLERIRERVAAGASFADARREVAASSVFTTHTPVPAGHDVFPEPLIEEYFKGYWEELGIDKKEFFALSRVPGREGWNMTALALRLAERKNGVSKRNGIVSREMWKDFYKAEGVDEVPIGHVTNGVHMPTWVNQDIDDVFGQYVSKDWKLHQDDAPMWAKVKDIPNEILWRAHEGCRRSLVSFVRRQVSRRWRKDHVDATQVLAGGALLDGGMLTLGFARRFAPYKRATLIFQDIERLKKILLDPWKPVQIVFAGKSHPADDGGKKLIQQVYNLAKDPAFGGHIAFIEDYDMHKARYLVSGVDVWLNNPLAPLEACGTSGQKAAANGVPNLSILDGWWEEGFTGENGWAPKASTHLPDAERDAADAASIYQVLEEQIVPLFYERGPDGVPDGWVRVMKESIRTSTPQFCSNRMLKDYVEQFYFPSVESMEKKAVAA
ncbi:MAG: alpha-glucan phosphorylase [Elusimicrobia bacterium CG_4_9_14_3_um_filter_62_55]|nr:MAG: alpha-glucan phosphorylase [Elusimicrobia bacterium CG22_combo_CG10-13_8_21_14_all_63_91]PJA14440.1 MAG: alpha-glucan phosphorylase [Elusimicrobia bacterium CG_4_10_14_0_2_um_filter_63_34]PJB27094.1 MAG: alpha-glucan phosphorylase [Elusimicrobia bacterium CG_4_9_14_3_um_filter_62_55]